MTEQEKVRTIVRTPKVVKLQKVKRRRKKALKKTSGKKRGRKRKGMIQLTIFDFIE